jgi:hypothetical protein
LLGVGVGLARVGAEDEATDGTDSEIRSVGIDSPLKMRLKMFEDGFRCKVTFEFVAYPLALC